MDKYRHKTALLAILQWYAHNAAAQNLCADLLHQMEDAGDTDDAISLELAGILVTGIRYNRWPWSKPDGTTHRVLCRMERTGKSSVNTVLEYGAEPAGEDIAQDFSDWLTSVGYND